MVDDIMLAILGNVVNFMEEKGLTQKVVTFGVDEPLVNEIYESTGIQYSIESLRSAVDVCLAHEWIEKATMGGGNYRSLRITQKGIGVYRSKRLQEIGNQDRSSLKKLSDYIEDHKGLFIVLGFAVTLITLVIKIYGDT